jgi:hypothetical protein
MAGRYGESFLDKKGKSPVEMLSDRRYSIRRQPQRNGQNLRSCTRQKKRTPFVVPCSEFVKSQLTSSPRTTAVADQKTKLNNVEMAWVREVLHDDLPVRAVAEYGQSNLHYFIRNGTATKNNNRSLSKYATECLPCASFHSGIQRSIFQLI